VGNAAFDYGLYFVVVFCGWQFLHTELWRGLWLLAAVVISVAVRLVVDRLRGADGPPSGLLSFDDKVAEAFDGDTFVGYIWVGVFDFSAHEVVYPTLARRTGDPAAPWEQVDTEEDLAGADAHAAFLAGRVDWFGPSLRLVWLPEEEAAAVRDGEPFRDPVESPTVGSELGSDSGSEGRLGWWKRKRNGRLGGRS
jgi:hypothetical protein